MATIRAGDLAVDIGMPSQSGLAATLSKIASVAESLLGSLFPSAAGTIHSIGDFVIDHADALAGGVLHELDALENGKPLFSISDLNLPQSVLSVLNGDPGNAITTLLTGADQIFGSTQADYVDSGAGADTLAGLDGADTLHGGAGDDSLNGNMGDDVVHGDDGADVVLGGKGNDTVFGDAGDDVVNGNMGADLVSGGDGNDTVYGGQGNDTVKGDAGDDVLSGDAGNDVLIGGAGADRFVMRAGGGVDEIVDFNPAEGDRIVLTPGTTYQVYADHGAAVIDLGHGDMLRVDNTAVDHLSDWIVFG